MSLKIPPNPQKIVIVFILIYLIIGGIIVSDYGRSPDEFFEEARANVAIHGFSSWEMFQQYKETNKKVNASAPSIVFSLIDNLVRKFFIFPPGVVKHYLYFCTFIIAMIAFYLLAKLLLDEWSALGATLLFGTQPLYFGHAFINSKDIPLMAVFLLTVALGFSLVEKISNQLNISYGNRKKHAPNFTFDDLGRISNQNKLLLTVSFLVWPLILIFNKFSSSIIYKMTYWAFNLPEGSFGQRIVKIIASKSDTTSITSYILKAEHLYHRYIIIYAIVIALAFEIFIILRTYPKVKNWINFHLIDRHLIALKIFKHRYWFPIVIAGVSWGLCLSSRIGGRAAGVAAGGMVGLYLLLKIKKWAVIPLCVYSLSALLSLYLFLPGIWFQGLSSVIKSVGSAARFTWDVKVLFDGKLLSQELIPRIYLPELISIQFTEPAIILGIMGFVLFFIMMKKRRIDPLKFVIICCWIVLPIFYSVVFHPTHYGNFRQYLFITPPVFILAGFSLSTIFGYLKKNWMIVIIIILILMPGIYSLWQLHPYQYIYYNSFVGGVEGAFRRFELDNLFIAYKEAMEYLNKTAPENAKIIHWRNGDVLKYYARNDLEIIDQNRVSNSEIKEFDYGIIPSHHNLDLNNLRFAETVFTVERDHAVLVVVKKIKTD
jgi:hypothetical protein